MILTIPERDLTITLTGCELIHNAESNTIDLMLYSYGLQWIIPDVGEEGYLIRKDLFGCLVSKPPFITLQRLEDGVWNVRKGLV